MGTQRWYKPGSFYRICDRTGFAVRAEDTIWEWDNLMVRERSWEPRQPQDFVKGVADFQSSPNPRPRATNSFLGPLTTVTTAQSNAGSTTLTVSSTVRMFTGDKLSVVLFDGTTFNAIVLNVADFFTLVISPALPQPVASGALVVDLSANAIANTNSTPSQ